MRNTPYPAHTFGNFGHRIVPLTEIKGMIQGIVKLHEPRLITEQDVDDFEYLAAGEKKVLPDETEIEIAVFDASDMSRGGPSSYVSRRRLGLEKGAVLNGPMSWRPAATPTDPVDPISGRLAFGLVCLVIAFFGGLLSLMSLMYSIVFVTAGAGFLMLWLLIEAASKMRSRSIERIGSAYVLARKV